VIWFRSIWERGTPFHVGKMLGNFGFINKHSRKEMTRKGENHVDTPNVIAYKCIEYIIWV